MRSVAPTICGPANSCGKPMAGPCGRPALRGDQPLPRSAERNCASDQREKSALLLNRYLPPNGPSTEVRGPLYVPMTQIRPLALRLQSA